MSVHAPSSPPDRMPVPERMRQLPLDKHGRPVPWFVAWFNGTPDHRVIRRGGFPDALQFGWCWVCGAKLGRHRAYVVGPMCVVNRISAEPPAHRDCAEYSARQCPFLSTPNMTRRTTGLPEDRVDPGGVMLLRNPGVTAVWPTTAPIIPLPTPDGGCLCRLGPLDGAVTWWRQGRPATYAEVDEAMRTGLPALREACEQDIHAAATDTQRARIRDEFDRQVAAARPLLPARLQTPATGQPAPAGA
jgi:hypothetical protein